MSLAAAHTARSISLTHRESWFIPQTQQYVLVTFSVPGWGFVTDRTKEEEIMKSDWAAVRTEWPN